MSNLGKWDEWYRSSDAAEPFGDTESYRIGADYLDDCEMVEDWGCGKGWFFNFRTRNCLGIDGSRSTFAGRVVNLEEYTSSVDGIFMRHVLEHNYQWKKILRNAIQSFDKKMVLAIFTPWSDGETKEIRFVDRVGVPDISFSKHDVVEMLDGLDWELLELDSPQTIYGQEHVFLVRKAQGVA
jgi:hypothetical protein